MKVFKKMVISPPFLFLLSGVISYSISIFVFDADFGPSFNLFFLGLLFFFLGFFCISIMPLGERKSADVFIFAPKWVLFLYWMLSFLSLCISAWTIYNYGSDGDLSRLFLNLRYQKSYGDGLYLGGQHLALFGFSLALYYAAHRRYIKSSLAFLIFLVSSLSIAERTTILFGFSSMMYFLFYLNRVGLRIIIISLTVMLSLFVLVAVSAGKTGGSGWFGFIPAYISYGYIAFDEYVYGRDFQGCLGYVFGTLGDIFDPNGCSGTSDLHVDSRHNVYTYVSSPYLVLGVFGVSIIMFLVGGWYGLLWVLAKRYSGYFLAILSCYIYGIVMVFYAWQFSNTTYIYMMLLMLPLFIKFRRS